jgi:hypothetical protein
VHDRDALPGKRPRHAERLLNAEIARRAGPGATVQLAPDFEGIAGLRSSHHKPAHAWQQFSGMRPERVPDALGDAVTRMVGQARS